MIIRIWHGWTTPENAEEYEQLVVEENYGIVADRSGEGYRGFEIASREQDDGLSKYVTITRFDSWDAVEEFGGEAPEEAFVPPKAREQLT